MSRTAAGVEAVTTDPTAGTRAGDGHCGEMPMKQSPFPVT